MLDLISTPSGASDASKWRQDLMRLCAAASEAEMDAALASLSPSPMVRDVRPAEAGLIMLRGRIGGDGAPFNLGEATVTRATVQLSTGEVGFGYLLGRSKARARLAAIIDAAGQNADYRHTLEASFVAPVTARLAMADRAIHEETAATRVEFFTMVRGED